MVFQKIKTAIILLIISYLLPQHSFAANCKVMIAVDNSLTVSVQQYSLMAEKLKSQDGLLPKSFKKNGKFITSNAKWWCSGFFPGTLWYLYEYNKNKVLKKDAELYSERIKGEQFTTDNHDVGFIIYCSYGNAFRLDPKADYRNIIINTAHSLSTRFNPTVGQTRSWDWGSWQYPVIIDNMMNLELLFNATKFSGDSSYYKIAVAHAEGTMENHFRQDASCYHVVSYNKTTGAVESQGTRQGFSDASAWARGQAWALYGYTVVYRETHNPRFLNHAVRIANYLLNHPHMPKDMIPYWDFDAPNIPNALRDASAGAVICSALIELSG